MSDKDGIYIGWIHGNQQDRGTLEKLGVKGHMVWSQRPHILRATAGRASGIFEHCECTEEVLDRLERKYPTNLFWRSSFTFTTPDAYRKYLRQFEDG